MKFRGGYNILLEGRPAARVEVLPEPEALFLPLWSRRFRFSTVVVTEGERIRPGRVLAKDPGNFSVPLLAPREGTVRLAEAENHIVLRDLVVAAEEAFALDEALPHAPQGIDSAGIKRYKLVALGAWHFLSDAFTGAVPDPFGTPQAVIVSTLHLEPFTARGDVQIQKRLASFTRGLEHLQSLLEYQPIHLVLPSLESEFAARVRKAVRGYAWVNMVQVPLRYPLDHFTVLARGLGLKKPGLPIWAMRADGVLAVDRALTLSRPSTVRILSVGGPAVAAPVHVKAMPGYPIQGIIAPRVSFRPVRIISGGVMTGSQLADSQLGVDVECDGLTVLPERQNREFLGFLRPGYDRRSYSRCFLSSLRHGVAERLDTALRGERRPCISCVACEEVCPVSIMPHLLHKYLHQDLLEEAERAGVERCIGCGLCSYVCPSKIELRAQLTEACDRLRTELQAGEVTG